jgi:hypothetical protein
MSNGQALVHPRVEEACLRVLASLQRPGGEQPLLSFWPLPVWLEHSLYAMTVRLRIDLCIIYYVNTFTLS